MMTMLVGERRPCQPHHGNCCVYVKRRGGNGEPGQTGSRWWEPNASSRCEEKLLRWRQETHRRGSEKIQRPRQQIQQNRTGPKAEPIPASGVLEKWLLFGYKLHFSAGIWYSGNQNRYRCLFIRFPVQNRVSWSNRTASMFCHIRVSRKRLLCWKKLQKI